MGFEAELSQLLNKYSQENGSDTPDFILAKYLNDCLTTWNHAIAARQKWYGREKTSVSAEPRPVLCSEPQPQMVGAFPRRCRLDLLTPTERALCDAVDMVEGLGAHVLLTEVVCLLQEARYKLADYVEQPPELARKDHNAKG